MSGGAAVSFTGWVFIIGVPLAVILARFERDAPLDKRWGGVNEVLARIQAKWPDRIVKARRLFLRLQMPGFLRWLLAYHDRTW
jgi:hypothetical protein